MLAPLRCQHGECILLIRQVTPTAANCPIGKQANDKNSESDIAEDKLTTFLQVTYGCRCRIHHFSSMVTTENRS